MLELRGLFTPLFGPVSLRVDPGECIAVHGPSGAGKTRLLRAIADLDPHEGEVALAGRRAADMAAPDWRRAVQLLPADPVWWMPRVGDHFGRFDPGAAEALGLPADSDGWAIERLSSGERQRLALLRTLQRRPRALLLDEPTANLDQASRDRVEHLLARYRQDTGAAIVWVSHEPGQRRRVATRTFRLEDGQIKEDAAHDADSTVAG